MADDDAIDLRGAFDDLVRFETLLWDKIDEQLQREVRISLGTVNLLLVIEATANCRVQDIAGALAITVGGTSQAVDRAEKAGWCVRAPHPNDRRSSVIELTDAGDELLGLAKPVFDEALHRLLGAPLAGSELASFARSVNSLRRSATTGNAPPEPVERKS